MTMTTLNQKVGAFLRSHKSQSSAALALLGVVMDHAVANRDWTPMAKLVMGVEPRMQKRMKSIIGRCIGGITGQEDPKAEFGYKFKLGGNTAFTDQKAEFDILVANKASIYGGDVEAFLGIDKKEPTAWDVTKRAATFAKAAVDAGVDMELLLQHVKLAYIAANAAMSKAEAEVAH